MKTLTFPRGIHPPEGKEPTSEKSLEFLPPPEKVIIPLHQHFGNPAEPLVKKGDDVLLGQKIGKATSLFSANVHASVSGKVVSVDGHNHPLGGKPVIAVTIANDGEDRIHPELAGTQDPLKLEPDQIRHKVKEAGIVGLGGAAFPTSVKITPPKDKPIDTVVINGCECEPILTADYRLMMEFPEEILNGAELVRIATGASRTLVAVEDNKRNAFDLLRQKAPAFSAEVSLVKTKYPQGAEKNLIYALLGREVPSGGLPFDVGVVVQNVGTANAIWNAAKAGTPLYERALTVSGNGIKEPKNLIVRLGTLFQDVIDFCGGLLEGVNTVIMGGPMMGLSQWALDVPVIKGTSGILAWVSPKPVAEFPCIRCSRCIDHCPMGLAPTQIMKYVMYDQLPAAQKWGALDCVECGSCQYICPAKIPLVHWIRLGKNQIISQQRKKSA
jgi:electron transport complex protein RnfC